MPPPTGARPQRSPNPFRRIRSAHQHAHRQQHVRHRAPSATSSPRPNRISQPSNPSGTAITPPAQHTATIRTLDLPGSQPGLDADGIGLYRHHRCLRALQRGAPQSRQRLQRGAAHPSVPRHTDGAHEQDQRHNRADHRIANLSDGHGLRGRYPERRSTPERDQRPPSNTETPPTAPKEQRRRWRQILVVSGATVGACAAIATTAYVVRSHNGVTALPAATTTGPAAQSSTKDPEVAGPVLAGTYRVDLDFQHQTINGVPKPSGNVTAWWAFRSRCTPAGCVATATKLDASLNQAPTIPGSTDVFHFVDGHWQNAPTPYPGELACPGVGTVPVTMVGHSLWTPQPDGTFQGVQTASAETDACSQGQVYEVPFIATRIGGVPSGVMWPIQRPLPPSRRPAPQPRHHHRLPPP